MSELSPITKLDFWFTGEDQTFFWPVYQHNDQDLQVITGWTIEFRMALGKGGLSVLTKAATLEDPTNGLCKCFFAAADTSALTPATYFYTLSRTNPAQNQVIAHGDAHLQGRVL